MLTHGVDHWQPETCDGCRYKTIQVQAAPAFAAGFNHSVGQYCSTDREFREALKRCGERQSNVTGIEHNYEPRYPGDVDVPYRAADEALELRGRALVKSE